MKNKQERENYFRDSNNWEKISSILEDKMQVQKLKNYPIVRVLWDLNYYNRNFCMGVQIQHILGCYRINSDYSLNNVYSMSVNQCVDLMTQIDKESK